MADKVENGTPRFDSESLCLSCDNAVVVQGERVDQHFVFCSAMSHHQAVRVTMRVVKCSDYKRRNTLSLHAMEEMAWTVAKKKEGEGELGFISPSQRRRWEAGKDDSWQPLDD